jgi:hypothetical protein
MRVFSSDRPVMSGRAILTGQEPPSLDLLAFQRGALAAPICLDV